MRLGSRKRLRVDREGLEQVCVAWWTSEHPRGPAWTGLPEATKSDVAARVKVLIKRQQAETPGDIAAIVAAEGQTQASAARAVANRARLEHLHRCSTQRLLALLVYARTCGEVTVIAGGDGIAGGRVEGEALWWSADELKAVLATREHIPSSRERKRTRQLRAAVARAGRSRPPRR